MSRLSAAVLQEAMGRIERGGAGFAVSFFASATKIEAWVAAGSLGVMSCEGALLIHREDGGLLRVSHVAADQPALDAALGKLVAAMSDRLMVADLVGRPEDVARVAEAYRQHGFVRHTQLRRMQRSGARPMAMDGLAGVDLAGMDDVPALRAFMERWLDPVSEQIQSIVELCEAVAAHSVLVVRDGAGLAGFLMYDIVGQSATLRYWHVAGDRHGQGIGSRLMHAFLARCAESRRVTLWVVVDNAAAIAKYHHYGFGEDGMIDDIMVKRAKVVG